MEISRAALPPRQPAITSADRADPLYPEYARYRSSCNANLIEADPFDAWKVQRARRLADEEAADHPRFREFQEWMRDNKGGARRCPAGDFPRNFQYWLDGGRW